MTDAWMNEYDLLANKGESGCHRKSSKTGDLDLTQGQS